MSPDDDLLEEKRIFLRVYERRDKLRFLIKKGVRGYNKVTRDLSACIIKKFNGYDISSVGENWKLFLSPST